MIGLGAVVGPQLRLDYRDQPLGEALDIAMEPVATYGGQPTLLTLANWGTGLLLIGRDGRPESTAFRKSRFVFAMPASGRLEAMSEPQVVPASSAETNQTPKGGSEYEATTPGIAVNVAVSPARADAVDGRD